MIQCYYSWEMSSEIIEPLTGLGSSLNDPSLPCFMNLHVWIFLHIITASSDLPSGDLNLKQIVPRAVWGHSINFDNYTSSGSFCLVSGFSIAFTHLKSVLCLVRLYLVHFAQPCSFWKQPKEASVELLK